ncbi:MAG: GIY-YIG nuclease family protein [Patescibacteria group bacterium]
MYFVYLIECKDGSLYTGITTNVERRFNEHKNGVGGHYTNAKKVVRVVYVEKRPHRSSALKREAEIKSWTRQRKLNLIKFKAVKRGLRSKKKKNKNE